MTSSFISEMRARLFANGTSDASNAASARVRSEIEVLSLTDLKHVSGGDDGYVDGSPKGSWKTGSAAAA